MVASKGHFIEKVRGRPLPPRPLVQIKFQINAEMLKYLMNNSMLVTQCHRGMPNKCHGKGGVLPFISLNPACLAGLMFLAETAAKQL